MANEKRRLGDVDPAAIRRVGFQHAIVTPPRESTLLDVQNIRDELRRTDRAITAAEKQLTQLRAQRDRQLAFLATFEALPVERVDGDPDVSLESPAERTKREANEDARAQAAELAERAGKADEAGKRG
jgi:hypothetical protein